MSNTIQNIPCNQLYILREERGVVGGVGVTFVTCGGGGVRLAEHEVVLLGPALGAVAQFHGDDAAIALRRLPHLTEYVGERGGSAHGERQQHNAT